MLGKWLIKRFEVKPTYISGKDGGVDNEIGSHAWLEYDSLVIDITADQFNSNTYIFSGIYVGVKTDWYESFLVHSTKQIV
ncbi:Putative uncharacterized protein [Moritella viscosa]|nr:Putative uncharacterized protein [Moritella viscosa]SHO20308.1 Putative uncharacterized protein [Moritella viscosa]